MSTTDHPKLDVWPAGLTAEDARPLLAGMTGSLAYGTHNPDSDTDLTTVTTWSARDLSGLATVTHDTVSRTNGSVDQTWVDVARFLRLVLVGKPAYVEVLFAAHAGEGAEPPGLAILDCRDMLVTAPGVENGYTRQIDGLLHRLTAGSGRDSVSSGGHQAAKCARTVHRLGQHLEQLWLTGELSLRLDDPDANVAFGRRVADTRDLVRVRDVRQRVAEVLSMPTPLTMHTRPAVGSAEVLCERARAWANQQPRS